MPTKFWTKTDDDAPVIEQVPAWTSRDSHNSTDASQKVHAKLKEPDAGGYIGMISVTGCSEKGEIIGTEIRPVLIRGWEPGGDWLQSWIKEHLGWQKYYVLFVVVVKRTVNTFVEAH